VDNKTRTFLTRILNEPSFRALAQKDPVKALSDVGITAKAAELPKPISLPNDEEIRALLVLDKPLERLNSCLIVFNVCGWPH
jgi:hypothetical protein